MYIYFSYNEVNLVKFPMVLGMEPLIFVTIIPLFIIINCININIINIIMII